MSGSTVGCGLCPGLDVEDGEIVRVGDRVGERVGVVVKVGIVVGSTIDVGDGADVGMSVGVDKTNPGMTLITG